MTTIEDLRRMAALAGERVLVAAIDAAMPKPARTPADLQREIAAAGVATATQESV